jgi:hypothetical protein
MGCAVVRRRWAAAAAGEAESQAALTVEARAASTGPCCCKPHAALALWPLPPAHLREGGARCVKHQRQLHHPSLRRHLEDGGAQHLDLVARAGRARAGGRRGGRKGGGGSRGEGRTSCTQSQGPGASQRPRMPAPTAPPRSCPPTHLPWLERRQLDGVIACIPASLTAVACAGATGVERLRLPHFADDRQGSQGRQRLLPTHPIPRPRRPACVVGREHDDPSLVPGHKTQVIQLGVVGRGGGCWAPQGNRGVLSAPSATKRVAPRPHLEPDLGLAAGCGRVGDSLNAGDELGRRVGV